MRFLEKDLETIIWENWDACYERGLDISEFNENSISDLRFRQLSLGAYGIADLVNIRYDRINQAIFIQVIECKKDEINIFTYGQACRYLHAIKNVLKKKYGISYDTHSIDAEIVLVGRTFDFAGDFFFIYANDPHRQAITYDYNIDGLSFEPVSKALTKIEPSPVSSGYKSLLGSIEQLIELAQISAEYSIATYAEHLFNAGDTTMPIVISAHHVALNEKLLSCETPF